MRRPSAQMLVIGAVCAVLAWILLAVATVPTSDLAVYRAAAFSLAHGISLYGPAFPARLPFTYPPFAAWPFVVLLALPWPITVWLWTVSTLALLGWVIARTFASALPERKWPRCAAVSGLIAAFSVTTPLSDHIGFGQINMLLMAAAVFDLCVPHDRRWPTGVLIGLAAAVKLLPGIFILYLLLTRRYRPAGTATAVAVGTTAFAALISPADSRTFFFDLLWHLDQRVGLGNNAEVGNQSLQGALLRLLPAGAAHLAWLVMAAVVGTGGLWAARLAFLRRGEVAGVSAAGLVAILVSPVSWPHYLVWLVAVTGSVVTAYRPKPGWIAGAAVFLVLVARVHRLGQDIVDARPAWPIRVLGEIGRDGYVLLVLAAVVWLARVGRPPGGLGPRTPVAARTAVE